MRIVIPARLDQLLDRHLRQEGEQLAFLGTAQEGDALHAEGLLTVGPKLLDGADAWHVALSNEGRQVVLRWAGERNIGLVEIHTHAPWWPAEFSATDLDGLHDWAPNVVWRLGGRPYAALVVAGATIDGLVWRAHEAVPEAPGVVERSGHPLTPTGRSAIRLAEEIGP